MVWSSASAVHPVLGAVFTVALVAGLMAFEPTRRYLLGSMSRHRYRRHWGDAARHGGLATSNDHVPTPVRNGITKTPAGERLVVRIPSGSTADDLAGAAEAVATHLEVREVRVARHVNNAR